MIAEMPWMNKMGSGYPGDMDIPSITHIPLVRRGGVQRLNAQNKIKKATTGHTGVRHENGRVHFQNGHVRLPNWTRPFDRSDTSVLQRGHGDLPHLSRQ